MPGPPDAVQTPDRESEAMSSAPARIGGYRWSICALLFLATTINYVDRQVLGILATPLQRELRWSESDYGWIAAAFTGAYATGQLVVGGLMDLLVLEWTGSYVPIFFVAASAYLVALAVIHLLVPDLRPARLAEVGD